MPDAPRNRGGRPPGSKNKLKSQVAQAAAEQGISPIEVMINAMRLAWQLSEEEGHRGLPLENGTIPKSSHLYDAVMWAEKAAPYVHARIQAIAHTGSVDTNVSGRLVVTWGDGSS